MRKGEPQLGGLAADYHWPNMARLAFPNTIAALSTPLVGFVDTLVIGQLGEAALIGGVAIAAIIFNVVFFTLNFFRSSTLGLTAQAVGAQDKAEELAVVLRGSLFAVACGGGLLALQVPIAWLGFWAMGAEAEVLQAARTYYFIRIWSAPCLLLNYVVLGWVLGRGMAVTALAFQTLLNGLNVVLSLYFVLELEWGVRGVALATVCAEVSAALLGTALIVYGGRQNRWPRFGQITQRASWRRMVLVNSDMLIRSLMLFLTLAIFTRLGSHFGPVILAANVVLMNIYQVAGALLDGVAAAVEQLSGRAVGAGNRAGFKVVTNRSLVWGIAIALFLALTLYFTGPAIINLMTTSPEVKAAANQYGVWVALAPLAAVVAYQMDGVFVGATWSREMRSLMIISSLVFAASSLVLTSSAGNHGLWIAFLVFLLARSVLFYWTMLRLEVKTFRAKREVSRKDANKQLV